MEEIMQSNALFIIPLSLAYLTICGCWFLLNRRGKLWQIESIPPPEKTWMDFGISLLASVDIFLMGQLFSMDYFIPNGRNQMVNQLIVWPLNNVIIFSPIFIALLIRKQNLETVFISFKNIGLKLLFGLGTSMVGLLIFVVLRGEWNRIHEILFQSVQVKTLSNFPAIFLENVALAFLFVRLKWWLGTKWAIGIPAILFALAHVPGSIAEGDSWSHIVTFFLLTGSLTTVILYTVYRSRDILWLGVVHYIMDVVIQAV